MDNVAAPAAAPVSTPTPVAPSAVQRSFNETVRKVSQQTGVAADPIIEKPVVQIVRDPVRPDAPGSADAPAQPVAAAPDAQALEAPAPEAPPPTPELQGELAVDDGELKLASERNADGTYKTKIDPSAKFDFVVTDKESGETKTFSKTIPELMRMAKDGIWGQKVRDEVKYYRENVPQWQETHTTLGQQLDDLRALNVELLTAPDEIVIQRREAYAKEQAPERRLERENSDLKQKAEAYDRAVQQRELGRKREAFMETRGLNTIITEAESKLGVDMVTGFLSRGTLPLLVNGIIPPERWPVLERFVKGPFAQWVAANATQKQTQDRQAALARQATDTAQRTAQSAVNDATRTMVPVGRASPDAPPEPPKPKNVKEAMSRMVHRPLPATVAAST